MRTIALLSLLAFGSSLARAQEQPDEEQPQQSTIKTVDTPPPPKPAPPTTTPSSHPTTGPTTGPTTPAPGTPGATPSGSIITAPTGTRTPAITTFGSTGVTQQPFVSTLPAGKVYVSREMRTRWSNARIMYGFGGFTGLAGTALTISSVIVVAATGYPCNPHDPLNPGRDRCNETNMTAAPTDAAPLLGYLGSSLSAFGFVFSAGGLGWQHKLLRELGNDTSRGIFYGGTALGVSGFVATGLGYFWGLTDYLSPHDQGIAILATTITSTVLCALGSLLFTIDSRRVKQVFERLNAF
jgi:hypothetical protein